MTDQSTMTKQQSDLAYLRQYFRANIRDNMVGEFNRLNRVIGLTMGSAVAILRGGTIPADQACAHRLVSFVLFQRVSDLSVTPAWTPEAKRLAKALRISTEVLATYSNWEPASLNDVLNHYPKVSAVVLERMWSDAQHNETISDLIQDEAREMLNAMESRTDYTVKK